MTFLLVTRSCVDSIFCVIIIILTHICLYIDNRYIRKCVSIFVVRQIAFKEQELSSTYSEKPVESIRHDLRRVTNFIFNFDSLLHHARSHVKSTCRISTFRISGNVW
jgi:hypothetical protein